MATLNATLTLSSTAGSTGVSGDMDVDLSVSDILTTTAPAQGLSTVIATATGANHIIVPAGTAVTYLYVKHSGTTDGSTASTVAVDIEDTADVAFCRLGAGEFAFFPANKAGGSTGVQLQVTTATNVLMEYAFFTKG